MTLLSVVLVLVLVIVIALVIERLIAGTRVNTIRTSITITSNEHEPGGPRGGRIPGVVYASPYVFTIRQRVVLSILPPVAAACLKGLAATCRMELRGVERLEGVLETHGHVIEAIWHESMGLAAIEHRNTGGHTLTSYSFDGEFAARVVDRFGMFAVRGSSSRGGSDALIGLVEAVKRVRFVGFTVDGPRGPRRTAKPGIAILAARTGIPIVPLAMVAAPVWRLHSWDRFMVPKPFARILGAYGAAIAPPENDSEEAVEAVRLAVERALNELHGELEADLGVSPSP